MVCYVMLCYDNGLRLLVDDGGLEDRGTSPSARGAGAECDVFGCVVSECMAECWT